MRTRFIRPIVAIGTFLSLTSAPAFSQWHVNANAGSSGAGTSWATAFVTLEEALVKARSSAGTDFIKVARGTYVPTDLVYPLDVRSATFRAPSGTTIQGGWDPVTDTPPTVGNATATVLSGDVGIARGAYHVVTVLPFNDPLDPPVSLMNLTVSGGNADNTGTGDVNGGGIVVGDATSSLALDTCNVIDNSASGDGGGLWTAGILLDVEWCRFANNDVEQIGGGLYSSAQARIFNSTFLNNDAAFGGGLALDDPEVFSAQPHRIVGCRFKLNTATTYGGAMAFDDGATLGGAAYRMSFCTTSGNTAGVAGGAVYAIGAPTRRISNSIFWLDSAPSAVELSGGLIVDSSDVYHPNPLVIYPSGSGTNINLDPLLTGTQDLSTGSPVIDLADPNLPHMPNDMLDIDGDSNFAENLPLDIARRTREVPTGVPDMGAYEHP